MCVRVPKNIPVKIKAKASWLTSSFLAAAAAATNEKCCRHNLQHFLLFKFSSCPRTSRAGKWGDRHIWHWHTSAKKRRGDRDVHCTLPCSGPCPCPCSDSHKFREREYIEYITHVLRIHMRMYSIYDACAFL